MAKRLIDADALIKHMDARIVDLIIDYGRHDSYVKGLEEGMEVVEEAPGVDAVEVVHGRWEQGDYYDFGDVCSVCDYDSGIHDCKLNYCPNCGANMKGEEK